MKHTILVTGGAGFIGSHTVLELVNHDYHVVVIDKACTFKINHPRVIYFQCDIADLAAVHTILTHHQIHAVIHCAAFIEVAASATHPAAYYENNVIKTIAFLNTLRHHDINRIIFSSSAAVYGMPEQLPLHESAPCAPINPYGRTKYIIEQLLKDYHHAYNLTFCALRYFNAAGAYPAYNLGERHHPETHLIPRLLHAAYYNEPCTLFGTDYPTPDGTCVRDYLHVRDIARAHRLALKLLDTHVGNAVINLGTARGSSIQEIISTVEQVTGKKLTVHKMARRAGDPAYLIADTQLAHELLGWQPLMSDIRTIISSAYEFYLLQQQRHEPIVALMGNQEMVG